MAYSVIERHIWHDEKFRSLSRDARDLFLYLLTSPHSNRLGLYVLDRFYAASDVQMEPTEVDAALAELKAAGRVDYDPKTRLVLVRRFLKHNPLKNPNVVTAACGDLSELPFSKQLWEQLTDAVNRWGKSYYEQLRKQLGEQLGDKTLNQDPDQDPDPIPEPTTTVDKSTEAVASKNGSPPPIEQIPETGQRIGAYLAHFMPIIREVGLSDDATNGSILKALAKRRAPPRDLEDVIRGLPLVAGELNEGELRWIYAARKEEIAEPAWNKAKRAYHESQKDNVASFVREMVG